MIRRLATAALFALAATGTAVARAVSRADQVAILPDAAPDADGLSVTRAGRFEKITLASRPNYALRVMEPGSLELCDRNGTQQVGLSPGSLSSSPGLTVITAGF